MATIKLLLELVVEPPQHWAVTDLNKHFLCRNDSLDCRRHVAALGPISLLALRRNILPHAPKKTPREQVQPFEFASELLTPSSLIQGRTNGKLIKTGELSNTILISALQMCFMDARQTIYLHSYLAFLLRCLAITNELRHRRVCVWENNRLCYKGRRKKALHDDLPNG